MVEKYWVHKQTRREFKCEEDLSRCEHWCYEELWNESVPSCQGNASWQLCLSFPPLAHQPLTFKAWCRLQSWLSQGHSALGCPSKYSRNIFSSVWRNSAWLCSPAPLEDHACCFWSKTGCSCWGVWQELQIITFSSDHQGKCSLPALQSHATGNPASERKRSLRDFSSFYKSTFMK